MEKCVHAHSAITVDWSSWWIPKSDSCTQMLHKWSQTLLPWVEGIACQTANLHKLYRLKYSARRQSQPSATWTSLWRYARLLGNPLPSLIINTLGVEIFFPTLQLQLVMSGITTKASSPHLISGKLGTITPSQFTCFSCERKPQPHTHTLSY